MGDAPNLRVLYGPFLGADRAEQSEPRRGVAYTRKRLAKRLGNFEGVHGFGYRVWSNSDFPWATRSPRGLTRQTELFISFREDPFATIGDDLLGEKMEAAVRLLDESIDDLKPIRQYGQAIISEYYSGNLPSIPKTGSSSDLDDAELRTTTVGDLLLRRGNVILYGPPGVGKTREAFNVARKWEDAFGAGTVLKVTFHPSYAYEDFVQGFRPKDGASGEFELRSGILLKAVEAARGAEKNGGRVLLVIDEINRADVARVLGELITVVEFDKREVDIRLAQEPERLFRLPQNLHLLGTMNTADKSISLLDVALRRRFAFVEIPPDPTAFARAPEWASNVGTVDLGDLLERLNERLAAAGIEKDRSLGHALISVDASLPSPVAALRERFLYDVIPLMAEYCYMDAGRLRSILYPLVDESGHAAFHSDEEFIAGLESIVAPDTGDEPEPEPEPVPED